MHSVKGGKGWPGICQTPASEQNVSILKLRIYLLKSLEDKSAHRFILWSGGIEGAPTAYLS